MFSGLSHPSFCVCAPPIAALATFDKSAGRSCVCVCVCVCFVDTPFSSNNMFVGVKRFVVIVVVSGDFPTHVSLTVFLSSGYETEY